MDDLVTSSSNYFDISYVSALKLLKHEEKIPLEFIAEFDKYKGWGHSTWQEAIRLGEAANVQKIIPSHHNPEITDDELDKRAAQIKKACPWAELAFDGMVIRI